MELLKKSDRWDLKSPKDSRSAHHHASLCKDVSRIDVPGDVTNSKRLILNPFLNRVFSKLNAPGSFQSQIVGPLHSGIVVIVENGGGIDIRNIVNGLGNTSRKIPEVNNFLGGCFCSSDLSFAGTEGGTFLALAKPSNGASIFEDDPAVHAANLKSGRSVPSATELPS